MNYEQFLEQMKEDLQARFAEDLPPELADVRIGIRDVEKLQGESYRGLSFRSGDSPVEANLNMTGAFQAFEAGRPYEDILEEVEAQLMKVVDRTPQFNIGELTDYEAMKPKLMMEVIPQKGNEDRLENIPHQKVEDMALIYRVDMGDSSGGNMALQLMLRLHDAGKPMPRGAVLYSPWSDMTASGDSYVYNYKVDPVFGIRGVTPSPEECKELLYKSDLYNWLGDTPRDDRYVSPALTYYDDTYPPIFVTVGGDEVLKSECELLVKKFNEAGVEATLFAPPGMMHAFPIYELFPEAQQGLRMAFAFIREKFGVE